MFRRVRASTAVGLAALAVWVAWWGACFVRGQLPLAEHAWFQFPSFGSDFLTQTDTAARAWAGGADPYADERLLFHYPPLVIRLFLWTPFMTPGVALRVWVVVLALLIVLGAHAAWRLRSRLGVSEVPFVPVLAAVLFSLPAVFTLERANFDLVTLAVLLVSVRLLDAGDRRAELLAGAFLAVGPWVKLYPGLLGIGLLALRRPLAFAGFVLGGLAIGLSMREETRSSFVVLGKAIDFATVNAVNRPFPEWSHSLSLAWLEVVEALSGGRFGALVARVPSWAPGAVFVLVLTGWVSVKLGRSRRAQSLAYPYLLWILAVGSCAPMIANDYSLLFLAIALVALYSPRDPLLLQGALLPLLAWWQPLALPIHGGVLLVIKLLGLVVAGALLLRRIDELERPANDPSPQPKLAS